MSTPTARSYTGPESLLDAAAILAATEDEITETIATLHAEQARRAIAANDPEALADQAFDTAFDRTGKPDIPYIEGGLLICPGGKTNKSKTSHDCIFVAVGDTWVWEYSDICFDDMRTRPGGKWMQAVSVIPAIEGLEVDVVTSQSRSGSRCQMTSARSFIVRGSELIETQVRTRSLNGHR